MYQKEIVPKFKQILQRPFSNHPQNQNIFRLCCLVLDEAMKVKLEKPAITYECWSLARVLSILGEYGTKIGFLVCSIPNTRKHLIHPRFQ